MTDNKINSETDKDNKNLKLGAVVLAGGLSTRMGTDKYALKFDGVSFLDRLAREFAGCGEFLVSVDKESAHPDIKYNMVKDIYPRCGAIGGLYSSLKNSKSDAIITIPCDVPFFDKKMVQAMLKLLDGNTDAVIAEDANGNVHNLCGIYRKRCVGVLKQCIEEGVFSMGAALDKLRVKKYAVNEDSWKLANINTPRDFLKICESHPDGHKNENASCVAFVGWKNSGKTTLVERLIPELSGFGLKVAAIKHDGHSYTADAPGTDSYRFFEAGAYMSAVYDNIKYTVTKRETVDGEYLIELARDADIVLLEGAKQTGYPKIEVIRNGNGAKVMDGISGRLAFVSDINEITDVCPVFDPDDIDAIAKFIISNYLNGTLKNRF